MMSKATFTLITASMKTTNISKSGVSSAPQKYQQWVRTGFLGSEIVTCLQVQATIIFNNKICLIIITHLYLTNSSSSSSYRQEICLCAQCTDHWDQGTDHALHSLKIISVEYLSPILISIESLPKQLGITMRPLLFCKVSLKVGIQIISNKSPVS